MGAGRGTGVSEPERWYRPKLIEISIPLEDINRESAREKSIRHGHPSTLHLWWARRPLAACRAVLFAQLVDDPSARPDLFPTDEAQQAERERLHGIIKRLVVWENIHDEALLKEAREEIRKSCGGNPPPILDPFAGGGSIPLEAQRLGLEAHASDLNPVAVLINKALIEIPPKFAGRPPVFPGAAESRMTWPGATGLAEDVRRYGQWMREQAQKRIGHLYPKAKLLDGTEAVVIAWIWARTVTCPNPACAGTMPLVRSFWLSKKKGKERYVEPIPDGKRVRFEIRGPHGMPREGTVGRNGATCLLCGTPVPLAYIRAEGQAGRMGAQLMAIAAEGPRQRYYLPPADEHEKAADVPCPDQVPDAELPEQALGFRVQAYGMRAWADLFTYRQLTALIAFSDLAMQARARIMTDSFDEQYANGVSIYLTFVLSRLADRSSSMSRWNSSGDKVESAFGGRQAIPMLWDFAESNLFSDSSGNVAAAVDWIAEAVEQLPAGPSAQAIQANAGTADIYGSAVIATDPPYYDNVGYADLSDFFYVWLRRSLAYVYPDLMGTVLTPKADELVADPFRRGGGDQAQRFFEAGFENVFAQISKRNPNGFPITVVYGFKQSETDGDGSHASTGWETLLAGMLRAGWALTATWPIRTERGGRMRAIDSNALASSIVLACRPRGANAQVTDRRGLIAALRQELPGALRKLQQGGVAPVDLPQAAIGPGMAVFSRYIRVSEPDGSAMRIRPALALINQVLDEVLSQQEGDFGADTRWCLEWFKSYGFEPGPFGVAETLSKAKNTSVAGLERAGVLTSRAGKVRLRSIADIPPNYDPANDERVSEWEVVLHLAKRLSEQGAGGTARLMAKARSVMDLDAVRELAYLMYSIAEKNHWADVGLLFNGLGTSWSDLSEASRKPALSLSAPTQGQLGFDTDESDD
jgi:putative DNA methylase